MPDKYKIYELIHDGPARINALTEGIEHQHKKWPGFEWHQVHTSKQTLDAMVAEKLLDITQRSASYTFYMVRNPKEAQEALAMVRRAETGELVKKAQGDIEGNLDLPDGIFDRIIFMDNIKEVVKKSLRADSPVHILLHGPPGTAKSLFMEELNRLPDSCFVLGSSMSKAGLTEYLLAYQPKVLIIDEVEKAAAGDLSTLLSLMESGVVTRMKYNKTEKISLSTRVYASANRPEKLPRELRSRFLEFFVPEYTDEQLREIAHTVLPQHHRIIDHIVNRMVCKSRDIRDIIKVGRLSDSVSEADTIIEAAWPVKK